MKKNKFELRDRIKITEEAAEIICSREPDADFDFNQHGTIAGHYTMGRNVMYEVRFDDGKVLNIPQSYLEKIEDN